MTKPWLKYFKEKDTMPLIPMAHYNGLMREHVYYT